MNKGFTLVELATVMIVIGLLIGGVLVGKGLVDSAKTQKIISQLNEYTTLTKTFQSKYRQTPGDAAGLGFPAHHNGNGDGRLFGDDSDLGDPTYQETMLFWEHLSHMLKLETRYTPEVSGVPTVPGVNYPKGLEGEERWLVIGIATGADNGIAFQYSIRANTYEGANLLDSKLAKALDSKMDDGLAISGRVQATTFSTYDGCDPATGKYGRDGVNIIHFSPSSLTNTILAGSCHQTFPPIPIVIGNYNNGNL